MSSVISSSWSMWSPWSFCSNNVMVRVRACSTVRGFKCAGHNKEFQSCDSSLMRASPSLDSMPSGAMTEKSHGSPPAPTNNDVIDPYTEDRRLAMHQLYDDYEVEAPNLEKTSRSPRTRPALPTEPREPIVIAQYAQRYPQPPDITGIPTLLSGRQHSTYASQERAATVTSSPTTKYSVTLAAASTAEIPSAVSKSSPATIAATETTSTMTTATTTTTFVEHIIENKTNATEPKLADATVFNDITHERVMKSVETSPKGVQEVEKPVLNNAVDEKSQTDIQKHANDNDVKPSLSMPVIDSTTDLNISTTISSTSPAIPHLRTTLPEKTKSYRIHAVANTMPTSFVFSAPDFAQGDATTSLHSSKTLLNNVVRPKSSQSSYEKVSIQGRQSRLRRLKMLNQRARIRPLAVVAVDREHDEQTNYPKHLEKEINELQKRIYLAKNKLAVVLKTTSPAPDKRVEDDTALALSWMFANMAKMMKEKSSGTVSGGPRQIRHVTDEDVLHPPSRVEVFSEQEKFILKHDDSIDPVFKVDRQTVDEKARTSRQKVEWSDWSTCNCGVQSRKSVCLVVSVSRSPRRRSEYVRRHRRSTTACLAPEYETRSCHSDRCQL